MFILLASDQRLLNNLATVHDFDQQRATVNIDWQKQASCDTILQ